MEYLNYTKVGVPDTATDIPLSPNLFWEIDASAGKLLAVLNGEADDVQSSEDKGVTWTVEVSGTAVFFESWHDRANELIYLIEQDGANNAETYVVDYSNWAAISITKHNGDLGVAAGGIFDIDIFLRDGNLEIIICDGNQIDARRYNDPWASIDINGDNVNSVSCVVIIGTVAYFYGDINGANTVGMYSFDGATVDTLDTIAATSFPTAPPGFGLAAVKNMAYDGDDTIYFIANDDGTGDDYLYSYGITADTITKRGKASYYLMRDRDTETGVKEKAWDFNVNAFSVYQLHDVIKYQLYKIAIPAITADYKIFAVTDNFLWASKLNGAWASEIWELENQLIKIITLEIVHEIMEPPGAFVNLKRDTIPIENNMIMKFIDTYTSSVPPILYRGTYNFGDEEDGTSGSNIDFITGITLGTFVIESDFQNHKKVLAAKVVSDTDYRAHHTFPAQDGVEYIEFYWATTDITKQQDFYVLNSGNSLAAGNILIRFLIGFPTGSRFGVAIGNGAGGITWVTIGPAVLSNNQQYHIKIEIDIDNDVFSIWIDDIEEVTDENLFNDNTFANYNTIQHHAVANGDWSSYFDAYGFSWDIDYTVGDNKKVAGEEKIIFEGVIYKHTETQNQRLFLESFAAKDLDTKPSGDYSGRSDEIITSLLIDYTNYVTKGTFSAGTAMGTITFGGEKRLGTILDEMAYFENWIWYLIPTGVMYYNEGMVDILDDFTEASKIYEVVPIKPKEIYNRIKVKGAYVDGVQVESDWQEDLESQQKIGINNKTFTLGFLNTTALCNIAAINLLTRLGKDPIQVTFQHQDPSVGFMQPGETITFEFNRGGITVSSDQFLITELVYIEQSVGYYTIRDELP